MGGKEKRIYLRADVYEYYKKTIEEHPEFGYKTVREFVIAALESYMEKVKAEANL